MHGSVSTKVSVRISYGFCCDNPSNSTRVNLVAVQSPFVCKNIITSPKSLKALDFTTVPGALPPTYYKSQVFALLLAASPATTFVLQLGFCLPVSCHAAM